MDQLYSQYINPIIVKVVRKVVSSLETDLRA